MGHHLVGLVVKASALRAADPGFKSCLHRGNFTGLSHTGDLKNGRFSVCLPCQVPGILGSAMGLIGPVSVYCDWVR